MDASRDMGNDAARRTVRWSSFFLLSRLYSWTLWTNREGNRMVAPRDTIKIVNVVGSINIGQKINLKQVTLASEGAAYNPKNFPASFTVPRTRRRLHYSLHRGKWSVRAQRA